MYMRTLDRATSTCQGENEREWRDQTWWVLLCRGRSRDRHHPYRCLSRCSIHPLDLTLHQHCKYFNRAIVHKRYAGYVRVPIVICDLRPNLFHSFSTFNSRVVVENYFGMRRLSVIHCWWESSGFVFCGFTPHCSLLHRTAVVHQLCHRYFNWRIYPNCSCWRLHHFNICQLHTRCWNWRKRFVNSCVKYLALHFVVLFNNSFAIVPKSRAYCKAVKVSFLKWETAWRFSTMVVSNVRRSTSAR